MLIVYGQVSFQVSLSIAFQVTPSQKETVRVSLNSEFLEFSVSLCLQVSFPFPLSEPKPFQRAVPEPFQISTEVRTSAAGQALVT